VRPSRSTASPAVSRPSVTMASSRPASVAGRADRVQSAVARAQAQHGRARPDSSSTLEMALAVTTR
jgi:hypothetical protein